MKMKRYLSLLLAGTLALALTACGGSAKTDPGTSDQPSTSDENWAPKENVTMIVSYKAGSGTDNTARVLAAYAEKYIGKPVIIENLEGGSGSIGWTALSQAAPDGYTLGFINLPNFNATISEGLATYTVDSFAPICNHVTETSVVLVKADSQFNTLEDLVKFAKDNPGKLKASTNGNRASNHIGAQVLATSAGFEYTDIPYGGTADQLLDIGTHRDARLGDQLDAVLGHGSHGRRVDDLGVHRHLHGLEHVAARQVDGRSHLEIEHDIGFLCRYQGMHHAGDIAARKVMRLEFVGVEFQPGLRALDHRRNDRRGRHLAPAHQDQLQQTDPHARHQCRKPQAYGNEVKNKPNRKKRNEDD